MSGQGRRGCELINAVFCKTGHKKSGQFEAFCSVRSISLDTEWRLLVSGKTARFCKHQTSFRYWAAFTDLGLPLMSNGGCKQENARNCVAQAAKCQLRFIRFVNISKMYIFVFSKNWEWPQTFLSLSVFWRPRGQGAEELRTRGDVCPQQLIVQSLPPQNFITVCSYFENYREIPLTNLLVKLPAVRLLSSSLPLLARSKEIWRWSGVSSRTWQQGGYYLFISTYLFISIYIYLSIYLLMFLTTCTPSPLPHRVPPSKQNRPPSTAPYRLDTRQWKIDMGYFQYLYLHLHTLLTLIS